MTRRDSFLSVSSQQNLPLSVLDLSPITAGSSAAAAVRNTIDLAVHADRLGYRRYWVGEHHLSPAHSSSSPAVLAALAAGATERIRVGSGATLLSITNPLVALEQFGTIAALYPGRVDLGVGRAPGPAERAQRQATRAAVAQAASVQEDAARVATLVPTRADYGRIGEHPQLAAENELLWGERLHSPDYDQQVRQILELWRGEYSAVNGVRVHANPAEGADLDVWILGSSAGASASLAGRLGLPFTANYHQVPASVLEAVAAYRAAFQPSATLAQPYVMVSVDVLAAETDRQARWLAAPTGLCVLNIRNGLGYLPYPTPEAVAQRPLTAEERELVSDRLEAQIVGDPSTVVKRLRALRELTGADELLLLTVTNQHSHRARSYELIADAWKDQ